jgi:hypothetical protein
MAKTNPSDPIARMGGYYLLMGAIAVLAVAIAVVAIYSGTG